MIIGSLVLFDGSGFALYFNACVVNVPLRDIRGGMHRARGAAGGVEVHYAGAVRIETTGTFGRDSFLDRSRGSCDQTSRRGKTRRDRRRVREDECENGVSDRAHGVEGRVRCERVIEIRALVLVYMATARGATVRPF